MFSTNLKPLDLADEASCGESATRSIPSTSSRDEYEQSGGNVCEENTFASTRRWCGSSSRSCMQRRDVPLLPCHPRDLLGIALDHAAYMGQAG